MKVAKIKKNISIRLLRLTQSERQSEVWPENNCCNDPGNMSTY
jgi:hypothetical protein